MRKSWFKKSFICGIVVLMVGASVVSAVNRIQSTHTKPMNRGWLYVGGSGSENYTTIQSAINAANPGDKIFVYNGEYQEQINVTKSLLLKGQNNIYTIVVGGFIVTKDYTTIQNFNITAGYESDPDGVGLNGVYNTGIYVSSSHDIFLYNIFWSIIGGNGNATVHGDGGDGGFGIGIFLDYSYDNDIYKNIFSDIIGGTGGEGGDCSGGAGGLGIGVILNYSNDNNIYQNIFSVINGGFGGSGYFPGSGGSGIGIDSYRSNNNNIFSNDIFYVKGADGKESDICCPSSDGGNGFGILLSSSSFNTINNNKINNITGGNGASSFDTAGDGGWSVGINLLYSNNNNISFENISNLVAGMGGSGPFSGNGGWSVGINLQSSISNNISIENISNLTGGTGGSYYYNGDNGYNGTDGIGGGIYFIYSNKNTITDCTITLGEYGILFNFSSENLCYHNNIINNTQNARDYGTNNWYNMEIFEGNYWSDYTGNDNNGDGIGDTPYIIPGGSNYDLYPFIEPNGWMNEPPIANFTNTVDELSVTLNASSSYDPDGNISSWLWDFGDGIQGTGENITHNYQTSKTYNVTLTVTDNDGATNSITHEISIEKFQKAFFFGRIVNLTRQGEYITFQAIRLRVITFVLPSFNEYVNGERFTISKNYHGMIDLRFIFALSNKLI